MGQLTVLSIACFLLAAGSGPAALDKDGPMARISPELQAQGARHAGDRLGHIVSGQLPISAIGALPGLQSLRFIRAASSATHGGRGKESIAPLIG
jgi:hypothetical protein